MTHVCRECKKRSVIFKDAAPSNSLITFRRQRCAIRIVLELHWTIMSHHLQLAFILLCFVVKPWTHSTFIVAYFDTSSITVCRFSETKNKHRRASSIIFGFCSFLVRFGNAGKVRWNEFLLMYILCKMALAAKFDLHGNRCFDEYVFSLRKPAQ